MFRNPFAEVFIPDGDSLDVALERTTQLAVGAHQDDIEIMAIDGIIKCFQAADEWFCGVVMTNGRSSPRSEKYADTSDDEMMRIRYQEQKKAAIVGGYSAQILLGYASSDVKNSSNLAPTQDLLNIFQSAKPQVVYTHNLADKHPTHVATALRVIQALRKMDARDRPQKVYGCEVWRDLDWMPDALKVVFDCSSHINLQEALLSVYDSQISGGKRYDLATMGRRLANATYYASHATDRATHLAYAMDLSPLVADASMDIPAFVCEYIKKFEVEVRELLGKVS